MADAIKRTYQLNVEKLDHLMRYNGLTLEQLASKSNIDLRTLRRKRKGEPAFPSTIQAIARALAVNVRDLVDGPDGHNPEDSQERPRRFRARIKLSGMLHSTQQKEFLIRLNTQIMSVLAQEGIVVTGQTFAVATSHIAGAGALRLALAVQAVTDDRPSWFLATVKPSMLSALCEVEEIDISNFPFGEIILTGWGSAIPESALRRASELLRCQPSQILDDATL